jgi:acyl carrier protein
MDQIKNELTKLVQDTVPTISIANERDYDRPLKELGVDSLDMMSILLEIFDRYQIDISDEEAEELITLNLIVAYINNELIKKGEQIN